MDIYFIASILVAIAFGLFLYHKKWKLVHIISILVGFIFVFEFSTIGSKLLIPIFPGISAASLWLITFMVIYGGGALITSVPLALHGFKREKHKIKNVFRVFIALGLIYTAVDNFTMGPFAAGPNSPYVGQSLCTLDATYYSEDVFFGCILEKAGANPFSNLSDFLTYNIYTLFLVILAGAAIGFKKMEGLVFEEPK